ncbi:MAG: DUF6516 family protein [Rhizobium sp.]
MEAKLIQKTRRQLREGAFFEIVLWQVPVPLRGSQHTIKYRLALVVESVCVLRYDNEAGKGDHKHLGAIEMPYVFESVDKLLADFMHDVKGWFDDNA